MKKFRLFQNSRFLYFLASVSYLNKNLPSSSKPISKLYRLPEVRSSIYSKTACQQGCTTHLTRFSSLLGISPGEQYMCGNTHFCDLHKRSRTLRCKKNTTEKKKRFPTPVEIGMKFCLYLLFCKASDSYL